MNSSELLGTPVHDHPDPDLPPPVACTIPPIDARRRHPVQQRRSRVLLLAATVAVIIGTMAGWLVGSGGAAVAPPAMAQAQEVVPADVAGTAELLTAVQLAGTVSADDFAVISAADPPRANPVWVNAATTVSGDMVTAGLWNVTVAVDSLEAVDGTYEPVGLSYYVVPISTASGRPIATAAPSRVPPPAPASPVDSFEESIPDDKARAASQFIEQYLTGGSEAARYLSPTAIVANFATPPYVTVVATPRGADTGDQIRVAVEATNERGITHQLEYTVSLIFNGDVWEVSDMVGGAT